jgi:hypothetical protein
MIRINEGYAQGPSQAQMDALNACQQALDGLITLNELAAKLEKITGGTIERYVSEIDG